MKLVSRSVVLKNEHCQVHEIMSAKRTCNVLGLSNMVDLGSVSVNGVDLQGSGVVQMAVVYRSSTPAATSPVGSDYTPVSGNQIDIQLPPSSVLFTAGVDGQTPGSFYSPC